MAAAVPVDPLPIRTAAPEAPTAPRFYRVCLRHHLRLGEVVAAKSPGSRGLSAILRCPGPATRPRTWPGQPPGTHRATAWGVYDAIKQHVVAIGTEGRIILLDTFDYPKALAEAFGLADIEPELEPDSPSVVAAAAVRRRQTDGARLTVPMVSALKRDISVPGWRIKDILLRYDISQSALWLIRKGQMWAGVPGPEAVPPVGWHAPRVGN